MPNGAALEKTEILLVEDDVDQRKNMAGELQIRGIRVLTANDDERGLRLFHQRASSISAVITDIRLRNNNDTNDMSGAELAKKLKEINPDLPVFCNSAYDVEDDYPIFEDYFHKGESYDFLSNVDRVVARATEFDAARFEGTPKLLLGLKEKYSISDQDFFALIGSRRLSEMHKTALLLFHDAAERAKEIDTFASSNESVVDTALADIIVVDPKSEWARETKFNRPVAVVVQCSHETWIAELFGFPLIYTYADTREEAIRYLLKFLHESYVAFVSDPDDVRRPPDMVHFGAFLSSVFG